MKKPAVVLASAALLTLAACGSSGGGGGNGGTNGTTGKFKGGGNAGATKVEHASGPVPIPKDAQKGGTLTVMTAGAPTTFDPTQAYYTDSTAIDSDLVLRSLTMYRYNPQTKDMQLIPDLATNLGTPNSTNTAWTFKIKKGIKYEDGTPVKIEDFAYSVKRSFAIKELPDGPTYQTQFFLDGDKYKGPFTDGLNYNGVTVNKKQNSFTIKMRQPFTDMDYYGSFPIFTPIPQAKDNPQTYGQHPLATGPYKFASYQPGTELKLVKNKYWDPKTDPGRIQAVDGWDFKFGQDETKLLNEIANDQGDAQTTLTYDNMDPATYSKMQSDPSRVVLGTQPCTFMWYIDMRKVKDIRVRKAIGYAYPYKAAWKAGGEIVGITRVPGTSILPPGTAGRVKYDVLGNGGAYPEPSKAKALLKQAGYKPGQYKIKFLYAKDDTYAVAAEKQEAKGLQQAGFNPQPIASTEETIRTDRTKYNSPINIRSSGWCSDWPDGGSWFPPQWDGSLVGLNGMPNIANFKEKDMDQLQHHILNDLTPSQAIKAWGQFDKKMETKYYPAVNIGYGGVAMLHGSRVGGMFDDNVRGMPTLAQMYITKQ
jgi:peptide/nickel transport system substrate-binding protein